MDLGSILQESGAILRGHFVLSSGRHSDLYFEKFRILERPDVLSTLCAKISEHYAGWNFDLVAGPTTGGIIIAFEVARQMGLPSVYIESEDGKKKLRRNKSLEKDCRCLIVDDVLTTGRSLFESRVAIEAEGGRVSAYAVLIDRAQDGFDAQLPLFAAYKVFAQSYAPGEVPDWLQQIPVVQPGTRKFTNF